MGVRKAAARRVVESGKGVDSGVRRIIAMKSVLESFKAL